MQAAFVIYDKNIFIVLCTSLYFGKIYFSVDKRNEKMYYKCEGNFTYIKATYYKFSCNVEKTEVNMKIKKILLGAVAFAVTAIVCALTAGAEKAGDYQISATGVDTAAITSYSGSATNLTIPSKLNGMKITQIDLNAFGESKKLTKVTIPDTVTTIGDLAFNNCTSLKEVTIPASVTEIGFWAFADCTLLKEVTIPASVKSINYEAFGYYHYDKDSAKTKKVDGFKINYVKNTCGHLYATKNGFSDEDCLVINELEDGTLEISGYAGNDVTYEIPAVIDGKKVTRIGFNAFNDCTELTSITIPDSVTHMVSYAFYNCPSIKAVTIPASVTFIDEGAFGYYYDTETQSVSKVKNFKIYCYSGSDGERYARDNEIDYELLTNPTLSEVTGAKLTGRAADALRINWTKNVNADGYIIEMYQNGKWARVAKITDNSTTTFRKAGLDASTVYKFRVRAYKMSGSTAIYSDYSATVAARTYPSVMKGAKLGGRAADALRINWTKNASADGYIVEMYQGNKWVRVGKITNNSTTTFRKSGLKASTVYKFRVKAYKMSGKTALYSAYSATVTARTNPSIMKGVKIGGKAKDALRVNWMKNTSAQGYIVEMYKGGKWVRVAKITNNSTTTFRKAGLVKNTTYKFRVRAYRMSGKMALYGNYGSVSGRTAAK